MRWPHLVQSSAVELDGGIGHVKVTIIVADHELGLAVGFPSGGSRITQNPLKRGACLPPTLRRPKWPVLQIAQRWRVRLLPILRMLAW
jgi:hypothetical protein